jgi:hypothetical protein
LLYAIAAAEVADGGGEGVQSMRSHAETVAAEALTRAVGLPRDSAAVRLIAQRLLQPRRAEVLSKPGLGLGVSLALSVLLGGGAVGFLLHSQLLGLFGN